MLAPTRLDARNLRQFAPHWQFAVGPVRRGKKLRAGRLCRPSISVMVVQ
jgi:hypothetical protein